VFDFLFDTNSVRDFAQRIKTDTEWDELWAAWKKAGYKSAWIPWTIGEVIGTNLVRESQPVTDEDCREVALAVRRFDRLAERDILLGPRDLIRWSVCRFFGYPVRSVFEEKHRKSLNAAKTLQTKSQITVKRYPDVTIVFIRDSNTGDDEGQTIPTDFIDGVERRVQVWKDRMEAAGLKTNYGQTDVVAKEPLLRFLWEETKANIGRMSKQVGIADSVLLGFAGMLTEEVLKHPFVYGAVAQDWFYMLRALNVKTGKVLETMGRDLAISHYIPLAKTFVTSDGGFAKLVKGVLPANMITFEEFRNAVLEK
jgi:hypothetical protein